MRYLVIVLLLLTGCEAKVRTQKEQVAKVLDQGTRESELIRYEDKELGIVCYRARNFEGFSCLRKNSLQQGLNNEVSN